LSFTGDAPEAYYNENLMHLNSIGVEMMIDVCIITDDII
jgi:hypothetical protein